MCCDLLLLLVPCDGGPGGKVIHDLIHSKTGCLDVGIVFPGGEFRLTGFISYRHYVADGFLHLLQEIADEELTVCLNGLGTDPVADDQEEQDHDHHQHHEVDQGIDQYLPGGGSIQLAVIYTEDHVPVISGHGIENGTALAVYGGAEGVLRPALPDLLQDIIVLGQGFLQFLSDEGHVGVTDDHPFFRYDHGGASVAEGHLLDGVLDLGQGEVHGYHGFLVLHHDGQGEAHFIGHPVDVGGGDIDISVAVLGTHVPAPFGGVVIRRDIKIRDDLPSLTCDIYIEIYSAGAFQLCLLLLDDIGLEPGPVTAFLHDLLRTVRDADQRILGVGDIVFEVRFDTVDLCLPALLGLIDHGADDQTGIGIDNTRKNDHKGQNDEQFAAFHLIHEWFLTLFPLFPSCGIRYPHLSFSA